MQKRGTHSDACLALGRLRRPPAAGEASCAPRLAGAGAQFRLLRRVKVTGTLLVFFMQVMTKVGKMRPGKLKLLTLSEKTLVLALVKNLV